MNGKLGGVLVGRGLKVINLSEHNPKNTGRWFKLLYPPQVLKVSIHLPNVRSMTSQFFTSVQAFLPHFVW